MKQTQINAYFEDLAIRFKPSSHDPEGVKHFTIIDSDAISEAIRRDLDFETWCLLLEEAAPNIKSNDSKAFHEYYNFRFTVCKDAARLDAVQRRTVKEESLELSKHIFAHIIENYKSSKLFNPTEFALKNIRFDASFDYYQDILNEDILGTDCLITIYTDFNTKKYNDVSLWN